jgi:hypothetical protein
VPFRSKIRIPYKKYRFHSPSKIQAYFHLERVIGHSFINILLDWALQTGVLVLLSPWYIQVCCKCETGAFPLSLCSVTNVRVWKTHIGRFLKHNGVPCLLPRPVVYDSDLNWLWHRFLSTTILIDFSNWTSQRMVLRTGLITKKSFILMSGSPKPVLPVSWGLFA